MTYGIRSRWGGTGFAIPLPTPITLAAAPKGGLTAWARTQSLYRADAGTGGQSWTGYVSGNGVGDIGVAIYDHTTHTSTTSTIHAAFQSDDHDTPAFLVRASDSRVLVAYSHHNDTPIDLRISTNPLDVTAWGSAVSLGASLGGSRYTYPQLHELTGVSGSPMHLYYRDEPSAGTDSRWVRSVSTDGGATWGGQQIIFRQSGVRSYWTTWSDADTIHYLVFNGGTGAAGAIGHFYYDGMAGTYHKSDGTAMGSPPFNFAAITSITSGLVILPLYIHLDGSGYPVCTAVGTVTATGEYRYYYLRWTGSAWISTNVASGGSGYPYSSPTSTASFGCTLDDGDLTTLYTLEPTGAGTNTELYRRRTSDGGVTWTSRVAMTSGSGILQTRVTPVRDRNRELALVWTYGTTGPTFPVYSGHWNMGTRGLRATT